MKESMKNNRVNGFLDVKGNKLVNQNREEVILTGWGLGNWLLCEGYMWCSRGSERFDRPRRIEAVIEELAGKEYAKKFWKQFLDHYVTEKDIAYMAKLGYNSVRIPINYRLFMEEGPGIIFKEEGFSLLDRCLEWCEKYNLYAFIDLHGAPGGQTGANIDDCIDDMPRLFLDQERFDQGIALWVEIAKRYKDRYIVGGYDLLNEPIRPKRKESDIDVDYLVPRLREFYEVAIKEIRKIDKKHIFSLEGHHWATDTGVFSKKYDEKMILHFHRYGVLPEVSSYQEYLDVAKKWDCPLWLGETGENMPEWFAAMYPLATELGFGYNIWPWKKMNTKNSPCSVNMPEGWNQIIDYTFGGEHPGYKKAQQLLDEYLENMKFENCTLNDFVSKSVLRQPGCTLRAIDFDEFPGKGISYSGIRQEETVFKVRRNTYMNIVKKSDEDIKRFGGFDCGWQHFLLQMETGEFASYTWNDLEDNSKLRLLVRGIENSKISISQDGVFCKEIEVLKSDEAEYSQWIDLKKAEISNLRVEIYEGRVVLDSLQVE